VSIAIKVDIISREKLGSRGTSRSSRPLSPLASIILVSRAFFSTL
jgi:hypothetical protein